MDWLQFNDFHIGNDRAPDIAVLTALIDKVRKVLSGAAKVDAVFLVGDIAYSGKSEEYKTFTENFVVPLRQIDQVKDAPIFAVPGNHDVKCDEALPIAWQSIGKKNQASFFGENQESAKIRKSRVPVFGPYLNFVKSNGIFSPNPEEEITKVYSDTGLPFQILAVNTSFFSHYEQDSSLPETPFPLLSLQHHFKAIGTSKPTIVLGHHCPSSLIPIDQNQLISFLKDRQSLYIHGHEHKPSVLFNAEGAIQTLGFGASYVTTLQSPADKGYRNSFAYCSGTDKLNVQSYSWEPEQGVWIDSTEKDFHNLLEHEAGALVKGRYGKLPRSSMEAASNLARTTVISSVPRLSAKPASVVPIDTSSEVIWAHLFRLSTIISRVVQKEGPKIGKISQADGRGELTIESSEGRHLVICIAGSNQVLSSKELEVYNTRLDIEDLVSVTVLSFGTMSDDAQRLYVRLKARKAIEVLTNADLANQVESILSPTQVEELSRMDRAKCRVHVLIEDDAPYLLVLVRELQGNSFHLINSDGQKLSPSDGLTSRLRKNNPDFASLPYTGDSYVQGNLKIDPFDPAEYLTKCNAEYNNVRYAALAQAGLRFEDLPLQQIYVSPNASETSTGGSRLEAMIDDYLASYALSDALKEQLEKQLLERFSKQPKQEVSAARDFCQRYGAVLIVGDPGAGKTCFVKNELLSYCARVVDPTSEAKADWYGVHIPVIVPLSEVVREKDFGDAGLVKAVARILARKGLPFPEEALSECSQKGQIAWFFDGLDEVVSIEKRALIVQQINDLVEKTQVAGNRFIVTSRPAATRVVNLLPALHSLEIQGFNEAQIEMLARRVLQTKILETPTGVKLDQSSQGLKESILIKQLMDDCRKKPGVARLAQNPLLLTLLMLIYANAGAPSAKRHLIYGQAIEMLGAVRSRETGHQPIPQQDLRERLGAVALSVYKKQSGLLPSRKEVAKIINEVMESKLNRSVTLTEADEFIQRVAESTGLIAVQARDNESDDAAVVTFMHHSFLEYYAAIALSNDLNSLNISEIVNQPRWHEVVTLLAGIIGDRADIAPILTRILDSSDDAEKVEAKLLLFAMDCALECELPSEASQDRLCSGIKRCLATGAGKIDPWVRSEIGERVAHLIHSCGGGIFESMLAESISIEDPNAAAAAIYVATYACTSGFESSKILAALETASKRTEDAVLASICYAVGDCECFRSDVLIQTVERSLSKTGGRKRAAFLTLEKIPELAARNWSEIINGIDDRDRTVSERASAAALNAGLNSDLITLTAQRRDILVKAFEHCDLARGSLGALAPKVKRETIEKMLSSSLAKDKLIGIQLLPFSDGDEAYVVDRLFSLLTQNSDHSETTAILNALMAKGAAAIFKHGELRQILTLLEEGTSDVRIAATKLLGRFSNSREVIEALLKRDRSRLKSDEYRALVLALGNSDIEKETICALLQDQVEHFLADERNLVKDNEQKLIAVLLSLRRLEESCTEDRVEQIRDLMRNYKYDVEVKKAAILCYPSIAIPSKKVVDEIRYLCSLPAVGIDEAVVQMAGIFAHKCKKSVEFVLASVPALPELRTDLIQLHDKYSKRPLSDDVERYVTELRKGISELTLMMVTFSEFMKPS